MSLACLNSFINPITLRIKCKLLTTTYHVLWVSPPSDLSNLISYYPPLCSLCFDHTEPLLSSLNVAFSLPQIPACYSRTFSPQLSSWLIHSLPSSLSPLVTSSEGSSLASSLMRPPTALFYPIPLVILSQQLCQSVIVSHNGLLVYSPSPLECRVHDDRDHISLIHHSDPIDLCSAYHIVSN